MLSYTYAWTPAVASAYVTTMTVTSPGTPTQVVKHHYRADGTPRFIEQNGQFAGYQALGAGHGPSVVLHGNLQPTRMATTAVGQTTRITDTLGGVTRLSYTSGNYPNQIVGVDGLTTTLTYNSAHQVTQTLRTGATGQSLATGATYTAQNRLQTVTGTNGVVTHYRYDTLGQVDRVVRGYGSTQPLTTTYAYDGLGRVTDVTQGAGTALATTTHTTYRADNQPLTITQHYVSPGTYNASIPDQNVWTAYGYDSMGRQIWSQRVDGRYHGYHRYDAAGRLLWTVENPVNPSTGVPTLPGASDPAPTYSASRPDANLVMLYGYDGLGRTTLVTDTAILTGTFTVSTKQWSGTTTRTTRTEYDALSRPVTVTHNYRPGAGTSLPDVNITTYTYYDGAGNVIWQSNPLGRWTRTEYDALSRPVTTTVNYENGNPATVDSGNWSWTDGTDSDIKTVTVYDTATQRVARTVDNYVDGSFDLVATRPITDRISIPTYDSFGRVSTSTRNVETTSAGISGTNLTQTTAFDTTNGRVTGTQDALGVWSSPQYDALGRTIGHIQNCVAGGVPGPLSCDAWNSTNPDRNLAGSTPTFDARWRTSRTTDALGRVTQTTYDNLGRVVSTIQNYQSGQTASATVNVQTSTTYNGLGQVVSSTDATGAVTTMTYNGLGQRVSTTDPASRTTTMGERWQATPDGRVTVTQIDGLGRSMTTITNYEDGLVTSGDGSDRDLITRTVYDRGGNILQTSDPLGRVTALSYDQLDRLIQVTENQLVTGCGGGATDCNIVTPYHYDRAGNRVAITDARTNIRRVQYDAADRPTLATDALSRTTSWTYNLRGEQLTRTDSRGTVTSTYDALGRQSTMSATGGTLTQSWSYVDELGRLTTWGDQATPAGTTGLLTYGYDALNRTTSIADPRTGTVAATYTARGQRASLTYPDTTVVNYAYTTAGELDTVTQGALTLADYGYDTQGRLATLARNNNLVQSTWTYDQVDRVTDLLTTVSGTTRSRFQYTLDRRGQRTAVTDTVGATSLTTSYGYDGLSRLTSATETGGSTYGYTYDTVGNRLSATVNGTTTSRTYDAANQVSGWTYDTAGNLTSDGTSSYTYDLLNRLSSVTKAGTTTNFGYHGEELIQQVTGGTTTKFAQDRMGGLSQVLQTLQGGTTTTFAYGLDRLSTLTGATRTWDMADALGSVHGSLDNLGALVTSQQYDPWGQPTGTNQPAPFGFTGEYQDGVSGLVYLRARWYHPGQGTLLGRDPFEGTADSPSSLHPYAYAYSNPTLYTDPSGQVCILEWVFYFGQKGCRVPILHTEEGRDEVQRFLDPASNIPGVGPSMALVDGTISGGRGRYAEAAFKLCGIIPYGKALPQMAARGLDLFFLSQQLTGDTPVDMVGGGGGSGGDWGDDSAIGGGGTGGDWGEVFYRGLSQRDFEEYQATGTISSHYAFFGNKSDIGQFMSPALLSQHFSSSRCVGTGMTIDPPEGQGRIPGYAVEPCGGDPSNVPSPYISVTANGSLAAEFASNEYLGGPMNGGPSYRVMRIESLNTPVHKRMNAGGAEYEQEYGVEWQIGRANNDIVKVSGPGYVPSPGDDAYWSAIDGWK